MLLQMNISTSPHHTIRVHVIFLLSWIFAGLLLFSFAGCSGARKEVRKDTGEQEGSSPFSLKDLYGLLDKQLKRNTSLSNIEARGYFYYKDNKRDLNLSVHVRHDSNAAFTRITFYGNLDDDYWGDVVIHKGRVRLYFPINSTLYTGTISNFDLYPFGRIHIQLAELVNLALAKIYLLPDYERGKGAASSKSYILYLENEEELQKLYFDRETELVNKSRVYEKRGKHRKQKAWLQYSQYSRVAGVMLPHKTELKAFNPALKAVIWFRDEEVSLSYKFSEQDAELEIAPGTRERQL